MLTQGHGRWRQEERVQEGCEAICARHGSPPCRCHSCNLSSNPGARSLEWPTRTICIRLSTRPSSHLALTSLCPEVRAPNIKRLRAICVLSSNLARCAQAHIWRELPDTALSPWVCHGAMPRVDHVVNPGRETNRSRTWVASSARHLGHIRGHRRIRQGMRDEAQSSGCPPWV